MNQLTFDQADLVYECCETHTVSAHRVNHGVVRRFVDSLRQLDRALGEIADDTYWIPLLRASKRYRYNIASLPLPLNHPLCVPSELSGAIALVTRTCARIYPQF